MNMPVRQGQGPGPAMMGRYRLTTELGRGGMGVVYLGVDEQGRSVAVKVLRDHVLDDPAARARLSREVQHLTRIRHPAVAGVIEADVNGDRPYVVTRYVPGPSLERYITENGPLGREQLLSLARDLSDALSAVHAAGVVHRDLKPANVLLQDGRPVLIDFGIAQGCEDSRLTSAGLVMGTPGFLAPEILEGANVTPATDWWAWAALLAFAASGRLPFGQRPIDAVLARIRAGECDLSGVEPELARLLQCALDPQPSRRPTQAQILTELTRQAQVAGATTVMCNNTQVMSHNATATVPVGPGMVPTEQFNAAATSQYAAPYAPPQGAAHGLLQGPPMGYQQPHGRPSGTASRPGYPGASGPGQVGYPPMQRNAGPQQPYSNPQQPWPGQGGQPWAGQTPSLQRGQQPGGVAQQGGPSRPNQQMARPAPPNPGRRTPLVICLGVLMLGFSMVAPVLALVAGLVWTWVARTVDSATRGTSNSKMGTAVRMPFYAVGGGVRSLFAGLLPVVCWVSALAGGIGLQRAYVLPGAASDPSSGPPVVAAAVAAMVIFWWGPGSGSVRRGTRVALNSVSPGRQGPLVVGALMLVVAAWFGLVSQSSGFQPTWAPFPEDPFVSIRGAAHPWDRSSVTP